MTPMIVVLARSSVIDLADDRRIADETALPHPMADDDDRRDLIDDVLGIGKGRGR